MIKNFIVVSRHWHRPGINVDFHVAGPDSKIVISLNVEDLAKAVVAELHPQPLPLWRRALGQKQAVAPDVYAAILAVIEKMKIATAQVPSRAIA
jgi:hypothetical protein